MEIIVDLDKIPKGGNHFVNEFNDRQDFPYYLVEILGKAYRFSNLYPKYILILKNIS